MNINSQPGSDLRRENLVGKHDSESVALKFIGLHPEIITVLSNALNMVGLEFTQCFSTSYLSNLTEDQRKMLSSLNGDLIINKRDKTDQKETIKAIVKLLQE